MNISPENQQLIPRGARQNGNGRYHFEGQRPRGGGSRLRVRDYLDISEHYSYYPVGFIRHQLIAGKIFEPLDNLSAALRIGSPDNQKGRELGRLAKKLGNPSDFSRLFFPSTFDGFVDQGDRYNFVLLGAFCATRVLNHRLDNVARNLRDLTTGNPAEKHSIATILALRALLRHALLYPTQAETHCILMKHPARKFHNREEVISKCLQALDTIRCIDTTNEFPEIQDRHEICASLTSILEDSLTLLQDQHIGRLLFTNSNEGVRWGLVGQRLASVATAAVLGALLVAGMALLQKP